MSQFARRLQQAGTPPVVVTPPPTGGTLVKPSAANTGVPAGTTLTVINGDLNITTSGTYSGYDVHGYVYINASNVTFKNSVVRGGPPPQYQGFLNVNTGNGSHSNVLVDHVEINPTTSYVQIDGVWGNNFTANALNIHGGVDGMHLSSNSTVQACYIHDLVQFSSDPAHNGGPTHNDGIQILDGANITVYGNYMQIATAMNSSMQITQDYGPVTNLLIDSNWMTGGGATLNISANPLSSDTVTARNNRFDHSSSFNCPILISNETTLLGSGNVYDDTGATVPVQQHD